MAILGIDLGTTNSLGAVYRNGKVELIPNRFGSFLTPSVVSVMEDGTVVTGQIARERLFYRKNFLDLLSVLLWQMLNLILGKRLRMSSFLFRRIFTINSVLRRNAPGHWQE